MAISPLTAIPFCRPYFRRRDGRNWRAASYSYTPVQYKNAYGIPSELDGTGQTVGIIELGGAWNLNDYLKAMSSYGINNPLTPVVVGTPSDDPGGANVEVMLDSCVIGGLAPRVQQRIYFGPNTDAGFIGLVNQAVQDNCDSIGISWGASEKSWSAQARANFDAALQRAVNAGSSVFVASGDNGSSDGSTGLNADYPAASPWSIGCGGTRTILNSDNSLNSEVAWSSGGGGFSAYESKPSYQDSLVNGTFRGVPDVAGPADPSTGWTIWADGAMVSVGGTSAVAPMWAAILCLLNQKAGKRISWLNTIAYNNPPAFRDIVGGSNGAYQAGIGWDPCTGLGTPNGPVLFSLVGAGGPPTPPPTPVPVPTPTPTPAPGLKQKIDAVFDRLIALYGWHPAIRSVLVYAKGQVDAILASYGYHVGMVPPTVISVIDAALDAAEKIYPQYAQWIDFIKKAVDLGLPLI